MDQRTFEFNNSRLTIKFGNILDSEADVIVSSDDYFLTMGGGVSACTGMLLVKLLRKKPRNTFLQESAMLSSLLPVL